ncbi:MAG TPA: sigma-70 family RNA polymerase sigma factor [Longimicrobium sp.]|nr:sigma-70 family RNA polymerase sigma factor [Longimicrobium sp.]
MADLPLCSRFAEGLPKGAATFAASEEIERLLRAALDAARTGVPGVPLEEGALLRHLAQRTGGDPKALGALHAADLHLAHACAKGHPEALAELDRRLVATVGQAVARLRAPRSFVDEVQQLLRQKLLVGGAGGAPKILDYLGRGSLAHWLRAAALRVALNLLESQKGGANASESGLARLPAVEPDPELALVKRRYAPEFKAALEEALRGLTPRERNFLRLYFVQGLTVEQIGRMEGTHKSTVSRWLSRARDALFDEVRKRLKERLKLSASELDSLLGVLQSQLDVSLVRVLR